MVAKTHEIAFEIAGKMKGDFSKTFQKANQSVKGFQNQLNNLNKQAADIDKVVRLRKEVGNSSREYIQAKQKVAELGRQISQTNQPTKKMIQEFNKAKTATEKAKNSLDKKKQALKEVEQAVGTTGIKMKTLISRQDELAQSADKARIAQSKLAKITEKQQKLTDIQGKLKSGAMSSAGSLAGIAAAAAPVAMAVKSAMNFEDMQAELGKYSDQSKEIFAGLTDLTKKYSKSAQDMTDMAANAMQAGIAKTKEDVITLVESQTQAAVAFGMTGDAVGSAWADIQSKMRMNVKETQSVFDIVNKLGNETSASSEDILQVLQRQGGTLRGLTALNEKQIAAMAGAFRSASVSSEVAATSMGTFVSRLTVGASATKAQQEAFEALGIDAEDMAKRMTGSSEEAQAAIQEVFARINQLDKSEQGAVIGRLFGNESGIKSAVATLASNSAMLGDNLKMVGDSANYAGSMFDEYMARANTTSEAMGIARNQITLISARIGQSLLPAVKKATKSFIDVAGKVADFVQNNQELVLKVLKVAGAVTGAVAAFHAMRIAVAFLVSPIISLYKGYLMLRKGLLLVKSSTVYTTIATKAHTLATKLSTAATKLYIAAKNGTLVALAKEKAALIASKVALIGQKVAMVACKVAMLAWAGVCKIITAVQWLLNTAMLACPLTWIIAAIAAVIAIGVLLYKNWDKIKAKCTELWQAFASKFPNMAAIFKNAFAAIKGVAMAVWNNFKLFISFIKNILTGQWGAAWQNVKDMFSNAVSAIGGLAKGLWNTITGIFGKIGDVISKAWDKLKSFFGFASKNSSVEVSAKAVQNGSVRKMATGGIATGPTLAMIGEGKESEAVIPLSKLEGMLSGGFGGGGLSVNFAPTINISGGSNDAYGEVKRGLQEGQRALKKELERLMANQRRLSYT